MADGSPAAATPRRIPLTRYVDPAFRAREERLLWPKVWQFACTEDCLPDAGDYYEYRRGALSALLVRGQDGRIRAFANACRHRGALLLSGEGGGLERIRCGYHHWCYGLDGRREGGAGLDLVELRCESWAGLVFVTWDAAAEPLAAFLGEVPGELAWIGMERFTCRHAITVPVACNWKLAMDAFNEAYHIHAVHPQLLPAADDVNLPIRLLGRHSFFEQTFAVASPRIAHDDEAMWQAFVENVGHRLGRVFASTDGRPAMPEIPPGGTLPDVLADLVRRQLDGLDGAYPGLDRRHLMNDFHYHVFPNLILNVFAGWFSLIRARPGDAPDRTLLDMWNFELLPAGHPERHRRPQAMTLEPEQAGLLGEVVRQDVELLPRIQQGMAQPGPGVMHLTAAELRIGHMHQVLDDYLGTDVRGEADAAQVG